MSVNFNQYLLVGVVLPFTYFPDDDAEAYFDSPYRGIAHHQGLCILSDGMGGKYTVIGRVLQKSPVNEPLGAGILAMPEVDEALRAEVAQALEAQFGIKDSPSLLFLTHYR